MTIPRTPTSALVRALYVLGLEIDSPDGVANGVCHEAACRLGDLLDDIAIVLPAISVAAGKMSRRSKAGKTFRAAADRLAAEVLADSNQWGLNGNQLLPAQGRSARAAAYRQENGVAHG